MGTTPGTGAFGAGSVADGYRRLLEPVIFQPWAERLIAYIGVQDGQTVLDVASGTGVVARAAARRVGSGGRVIASDISPAMLAHVNEGAEEVGAAIETLECSATELTLPDASVDVVFCQQGLPFIPDRVGAAREMRRVLHRGGQVAVAVWCAGLHLEPFDTYTHAVEALGIPDPFPHAFDTTARQMASEEIESCLSEAGFQDVSTSIETLPLKWSTRVAAAEGIMGTPFAPTVTALPSDRQNEFMTSLQEEMSRGEHDANQHVMTAVFGRATA
jgi:ubiquinone/menaquinone biosynthesis C-methylase UbiE